MTDTITIEGREYTWTVEYDCDIGAPWGEHDGHGPVTEWTTRPKGPGERVLAEDRGSYRYYDYAEACRIAKRDGWSTTGIRKRQAAGEVFTPKQIAAEAAAADFNYLRGWCNDEWCWAGVVVTSEDDETDSLWGIESDAFGYHETVAQELAEELHARYLERRAQACLSAYVG